MKQNWEYKKIKEICNKDSSNIVLNKMQTVNGDYPLYGASGFVQNIDFCHRKEPYIGIVKDGSGCGRVDIYPANSSLVGTMQYILPKDGNLLNYVSYVLKSVDYKKIINGAAIPHIYFKDYGEILVPVPPLATQSAIVSELDSLSAIIADHKSLLKKYDELEQAIFYDMFGDPVKNEKGWEVKKLSEIGSIGRGVSKHRPRNAPELLGGTMPLIQTGDVANADFYINNYNSTYSELGVAQSKVWKKGTLCITIAATIGKCAFLNFDACFPDSVVGFVSNEEFVDNIFVYFIFRNMQKILEDAAPCVAQKNINLAILEDLNIPIPPLPLQQQFASKIEAIEAMKADTKKSLEKAEELFNARMDFYFNA